jgi:hypothetical protein
MIIGILLRSRKGKKLTNDLVSKTKDLTKRSKQKAIQSLDKMKEDVASSPPEI